MRPQNTPQFTKEQLTSLLRRAARELGRTPTRDHCKQIDYLPAYMTYRNYFGSWTEALKSAGLKINKVPKLSRAALLEDIQRVACKLGRTPALTEYQELGNYSWPAINNHGGWHSFIDELELERIKYLRPEDIFDKLRNVVDDLGYVPTMEVFSSHPLGCSRKPIFKHFDSYDAFVLAAGFDLPERNFGPPSISDEDLIAELRRIHDILGRSPHLDEFTELSVYHGDTASRKFGTYNDFLKSAGLEPFYLRKYECRDGHIVRSLFEMQVDNFLYENDIPHHVGVLVCQGRYWTCDFVVGDLWIEVDGFNGTRPNQHIHEEKLSFYQENSYNFMVIKQQDDWRSILRSIVCR